MSLFAEVPSSDENQHENIGSYVVDLRVAPEPSRKCVHVPAPAAPEAPSATRPRTRSLKMSSPKSRARAASAASAITGTESITSVTSPIVRGRSRTVSPTSEARNSARARSGSGTRSPFIKPRSPFVRADLVKSVTFDLPPPSPASPTSPFLRPTSLSSRTGNNTHDAVIAPRPVKASPPHQQEQQQEQQQQLDITSPIVVAPGPESALPGLVRPRSCSTESSTPKCKSPFSAAFGQFMALATTAASPSLCGVDIEDDDVIRSGTLHKVGTDGVYNCRFVLTKTEIHYHVIGGALLGSTSNYWSIPLSGVVIKRADTLDSFFLLTKLKSFIVGCDSSADCKGWMQDIDKAAHAVQLEELGRILTAEEMCPVFAYKAYASRCLGCNKGFGLLSRRHHCRNCGKCVCDECSREKVRIPRMDERILFKVCNDCARELKNNRVYGVPAAI